ncbi:MAG: diacylglycerol kinase [Candidatus Magasanikbacteria bacterium]
MLFSCRRFWQSFGDAWRGIRFAFKNEQNFRVQIFTAVAVLVLMFYWPLKIWERILLLLLILMVLGMELLNTAIEKFSDLLVPRLHQQVSIIKDVMAAAVLITSVGAAVVGMIIFWPYLVK